jgi:hypothetical protein
VLLLLCYSAGAGAQTVALYSDPAFTDPYLGLGAPGVIPIYVVVHSPTPVTAVQYWAPIPNCWEGATYFGDDNQFPVTIGDSQSGIAIAFGDCLSEPVHVQTINVLVSQPLPSDVCCWFQPQPHPQSISGEIEFADCDQTKFFGIGSPGVVGDGNAPPVVSNRQPADGALSRPLDSQLSWETASCSLYPHTHSVYFGTTPDPPQVAPDHEPATYDPGLLLPNTTYYWKIMVWHHGSGGTTTTPVWNFATEDAVPAKQSTWGAIKALYR